jgi:hypothetical protein
LSGQRPAGRERLAPPASLVGDHIDPKIRVQRVFDDMLAHVHNGAPLNLSAPLHRETTEALHRLVHLPAGKQQLKVIYRDGEPGRPFPVGGLSWPSGGESWVSGMPTFHLGTLSFRHVDYDRFVDVYLLRDRETRHLTDGQIDERAFRRMQLLLESSVFDGPCQMVVFQAGLEPLAVGLYRALAAHLVRRNTEGRGIMRVRPVFEVGRDGRWESGKVGALWIGGRA